MNSSLNRITSIGTLAALLTITAGLRAADYTWTGAASAVWDSSAANWSGAGSTWVNDAANNAIFGSLTVTTINFGQNLTVGTLSTTGGNTVNFTGGAGTSIDVTNITTAGTGNGSIDMSKVITGNHDLNYSSTATASGGRLNLKNAATYTGNTILTGSAYLNLDGGVDNILPTGTLLSLGTGTTMRLGRNATSSHQIAGLSGAGTVLSQSTAAQQHTLVIGTSSANAAQTFTGALNNATSTLNLRFVGTGTQTISGAAKAYSGATSIEGGTVIFGSNLTNTTSVSVIGGVLSSNVANVNLGVGAVSASGGEISAGGNAAVGTFTLAANQAFSATNTKLTFNIGTALDQIKGSGTGTFAIGTGTEIALITGAGFNYANTYSLLNGFTSGSVASTGVTITGYDTTNYIASLSNAGVLSFSASAVPEPSTYALLGGVAALGFVVIRRRLAKKA